MLNPAYPLGINVAIIDLNIVITIWTWLFMFKTFHQQVKRFTQVSCKCTRKRIEVDHYRVHAKVHVEQCHCENSLHWSLFVKLISMDNLRSIQPKTRICVSEWIESFRMSYMSVTSLTVDNRQESLITGCLRSKIDTRSTWSRIRDRWACVINNMMHRIFNQRTICWI